MVPVAGSAYTYTYAYAYATLSELFAWIIGWDLTSVLLVMMLSQPRVLLAMARDGLIPKSFFEVIRDKFRTPWKSIPRFQNKQCVGPFGL